MHHPSDLCVCVPQIESMILLFLELILETDYLISQNETLLIWNILNVPLSYSSFLPQFSATLLTFSFLPKCEYSRVFEGLTVSLLFN